MYVTVHEISLKFVHENMCKQHQYNGDFHLFRISNIL